MLRYESTKHLRAKGQPESRKGCSLLLPEHAESMQCWHLDNKGKQIIDDGVEELVCHLTPGQVRNTLQLVVEVQLQAGQ